MAKALSLVSDTIEVSVIVPLYNEEQNIAPLTAKIAAAMAPLGLAGEMILIDDGSRDGTAAALNTAAQTYPELVPLTLRRNYGQTTAMQAGFEHARGALIVTLDGDLQNDPADIPAMLARQKLTGADIVSGWRRQRLDHAITSNLPSRIANHLIGKMPHSRKKQGDSGLMRPNGRSLPRRFYQQHTIL
jgi:glycosyltransferase involved in cell wall biosynthesis